MSHRYLARAALFCSALALVSTGIAQTPDKNAAIKPADKKAVKPAVTKVSCTQTEQRKNVKVKITTSMGALTLELDKEKAPISSANFVKYVDSGHYTGTIFHRVIDGFMVQGGGFTKDMRQKNTDAPIQNESTNGLRNDLYTVAMARTGVRDSATSQFFINVKNNDFLNFSGESPQGWGYAVFGRVIEGTEVVDKMRAVPISKGGPHENLPVTPIIIEKVECL